MKNHIVLTAAAILMATVAAANDPPDMPEPKVQATQAEPAVRRFYTRTTKIELSVEVAAMGTDIGISCQNLAQTATVYGHLTIPGNPPTFRVVPMTVHAGHEDWLPVSTCGQMILWQVGTHAVGEGLSYLLHRTGHHKLEHVLRFGFIAGNVSGTAYSFEHVNR
jgi:hypothetical protein